MEPEKDDRAVGNMSFKLLLNCMDALVDQGMEVKHLERLATDKMYAKKVAECMIRGGVDMPMDYKVVKAVMAENFFGVEDWERHFQVKFNKTMLAAAAKFPWDADVLNSSCPFVKGKTIRETHIAFLGLDSDGQHPMKPRRVSMLYASFGFVHFGIQPDRLQKQTCDLRWYLMPILPHLWVGGGYDWKSRLDHLPDGYEQSYFIEELVKVFIMRTKGISVLEEKISYGCMDKLDHSQVAELVVSIELDLKLLPAWPASRKSFAAGDSAPLTPPFAVGVSRKLPS